MFGQPNWLNYIRVVNRRRINSKLAEWIEVGRRLVAKTCAARAHHVECARGGRIKMLYNKMLEKL